jgi:hypothetical protein
MPGFKARLTNISTGDGTLKDSGQTAFTNQSSKAVTFATAFTAAPVVLCDCEGDNVNAWPGVSTTAGVTLYTSANFTGNVNWQAEGS